MKYLSSKYCLLLFLLITTQSGLAVLPEALTVRDTDLKLHDQKAIKDTPPLDTKQEVINPTLREALQDLSASFNHFYTNQADKGNTATKEYLANSNDESPPKASAGRHHINFNGQMDTALEGRLEKDEDSVNTEITLGATPASPKIKGLGDFILVKLDKKYYEQLKIKGTEEAELQQYSIMIKSDSMDNSTLLGTCSCNNIYAPASHQVDIQSLFNSDCKVHIVQDAQNQLYVRLFHGTNLKSINSFHINGIKPVGDGQMGKGFYLSSNFSLANLFAYIKATNYGIAVKKAPGMIIETWAPFGLKVKRHFPSCYSVPNETHVEQESRIWFKFVFRDKILPQLKAVRGYITKY